MSAGHTRGPWKVWEHPNPGFGCEVRMADPPTVESVCVAEHCTPADARLIAAAPDLLEVLETIENDAGQVPAWLWDRIRAAIAKATGGDT